MIRATSFVVLTVPAAASTMRRGPEILRGSGGARRRRRARRRASSSGSGAAWSIRGRRILAQSPRRVPALGLDKEREGLRGRIPRIRADRSPRPPPPPRRLREQQRWHGRLPRVRRRHDPARLHRGTWAPACRRTAPSATRSTSCPRARPCSAPAAGHPSAGGIGESVQSTYYPGQRAHGGPGRDGVRHLLRIDLEQRPELPVVRTRPAGSCRASRDGSSPVAQ